MIGIKGTTIRGVLRSIKDNDWPVPPLLASLPPTAREHYATQIVPSTWYPYPAFTALLEAIDRSYGKPGADVVEEIGRSVAVRDLGTTFRLLLNLAKIEFVGQRAHVMWARHCNRGECRMPSFSSTGCLGEIRDFPEVHPIHCRYMVGWIQGLATGIGAENARTTHTRCSKRGDPICEYTTRWTRLRRMFS
jgi:hypothetical protein